MSVIDRRQLSRRNALLLAGAPGVFLAVFFAWPVGAIIWRGLAPEGSLDLRRTFEIATASRWWKIAWFTTWQAGLSTAITMLAGLPVARAFARFDFPGRRWIRAAFTIPFVLPTVVVGTAFIALLGADSPIGLNLRDTVTAVIVAHVFFNIAIVVRTVGDAWARLDPSTEHAARTLGAGPLRTWFEITAPRLVPSMLAAGSIVFLFSFTSFGVVLLLGGPARTTLEVETYIQTTAFLRLDVAAILALMQLAIVVAVLAGQRRVRIKLQAGDTQRSETANRRRLTLSSEGFGVALTLALTGAFMITPLAMLVHESFRGPGGYSLTNYESLNDGTSIMFVTPLVAIWNSVRFGVVAMFIAVGLGGLASAVIAYGNRSMSRIFDLTLMLPLGTSAATLGFGILITLDEPPLDLRTSVWLIPIAHALVGIPFVIRLLVPTIGAIDDRLRDAATVLGASPWRTWLMVDLPLIKRAVVAAAGFAFAVSLGEFGATAFIARPEHPTLPVAIVRSLSRPGATNFGQAMAMSSILMAVTVVAVLVIERFRIGDNGDF